MTNIEQINIAKAFDKFIADQYLVLNRGKYSKHLGVSYHTKNIPVRLANLFATINKLRAADPLTWRYSNSKYIAEIQLWLPAIKRGFHVYYHAIPHYYASDAKWQGHNAYIRVLTLKYKYLKRSNQQNILSI